MKPTMIKPVSTTLGYKTRRVTRTSAKSGRQYEVDEVPCIELYTTTRATTKTDSDGKVKYVYHVADPNTDLQYDISAPNKMEVKFGTVIQAHNVTCGLIPNTTRVWITAESVNLKK
ncbi:hypothetical protein [Lactobacillus johnsonii]|uniref:hypothetical protein n=1 Tax=Lactobacillus johnsonii TaxID=33959 RepID=UPI00366921B3